MNRSENRSETELSPDISGEVKKIEFDLSLNLAKYFEAEAQGNEPASLVLQKQAILLLARMLELDPNNTWLKKLDLDDFLKDLSFELTKKINSKAPN